MTNPSGLIDLLNEIQACVQETAPVHNRLFGFSLGKLLPFLGRSEPEISAADLETLRTVQTRLAACHAVLETRLPDLSLTERGTLNEFLAGLMTATAHMYRIAERQHQKGIAPGSYPPEQFQQDASLYESARTRYQRAGRDVFQIGRAAILARDGGD